MIEVPDDYGVGVISQGGTSCAKCIFLGEDMTSCNNTRWVKSDKEGGGHGRKSLPVAANDFCCVFFMKLENLDTSD